MAFDAFAVNTLDSGGIYNGSDKRGFTFDRIFQIDIRFEQRFLFHGGSI